MRIYHPEELLALLSYNGFHVLKPCGFPGFFLYPLFFSPAVGLYSTVGPASAAFFQGAFDSSIMDSEKAVIE